MVAPDRPAYGCYPENRGKDNVGHSFHFLEALDRSRSLPAAHAETLFTDRTPDVPIRTSDVYLAARTGPPAGSAITVQTGANGGNSAAALAFINANNTLNGSAKSTDESGNSTTVTSCGSIPP